MKGREHFTQHANGHKRGQIRFIIGVFLAVMGYFWLSKRAGWFPCETHNTSLLWPIVVMTVGVILLFGRYAKDRREAQK